MKYLIFSFLICSLLSACSNKVRADKENGTSALYKKLPSCIKQKIDQLKKDPVKNPPKKVYQYTYHDSAVYYITSECCDMFSELYDANCNLMGHPDGGFTGRGDGKLPDFSTAATNQQLVWEDLRK